MNINNFNELIDKKILSRGYDYYLEGVVEFLDKNNNEYIFQVEGSYLYEVSVELDDDGEIIHSQCDCPYDMGPICKHEVASYYELSKIINSKEAEIDIKNKRHPSLIDVLNKLSKEELIEIITDITQNDTVLKNNLLLMYSQDSYEQEIEKAEKLINSIVNKYVKRNGYIEYYQTYLFSSEIYTLIEKARVTEDKLLAIDILFLVINSSIEAYEYADDSDGSIGGLIQEAFEEIETLVDERKEYEISLQIEIFNKLLKKVNLYVFDGWSNYKTDILNICVEFADIEECRYILIEKIKNEISENVDNHYTLHMNEEMLKIIFYIIDKFESKKDAEKFILDNIKYTYFKELYIKKLLDAKDFNKVIKLTCKWEKSDKNNTTKWKKVRYSAYKELAMKTEQIELARELLFDGNFDYYIELKELMNENSKDFYNKLKSELKKSELTVNKYINKRIFIELIEYENDLDEILQIVKEQPHKIEEYGDRLFIKFPDEVIKAYETFIKHNASIASKRKDYANACWDIKKYEKYAGKHRVIELVSLFKDLYKKRPAFIDELKKIKI